MQRSPVNASLNERRLSLRHSLLLLFLHPSFLPALLPALLLDVFSEALPPLAEGEGVKEEPALDMNQRDQNAPRVLGLQRGGLGREGGREEGRKEGRKEGREGGREGMNDASPTQWHTVPFPAFPPSFPPSLPLHIPVAGGSPGSIATTPRVSEGGAERRTRTRKGWRAKERRRTRGMLRRKSVLPPVQL